jgi:pimeloyl-ACP methyl ester carboxylesterase
VSATDRAPLESFVAADGFEVRVLAAGEGPPLVCLHGAAGPRWSDAHSLLAASGRRVLLIEAPGFGRSAVNERSHSMPELARTVLATCDALALESFAVWGTSFGGRLALWLAAQAPARVEALVLAAPAAILPDGPVSLPTPDMIFHHPERLAPRPPMTPEVDAQQRALVARLMGSVPRDAELEQRMASLDVPTLVVWGTEDRAISPQMAREYPALMPRCRLVFVYDAGHGIDSDRPEAFASVVGDFLARGEQFVVRSDSGLLYR